MEAVDELEAERDQQRDEQEDEGRVGLDLCTGGIDVDPDAVSNEQQRRSDDAQVHDAGERMKTTIEVRAPTQGRFDGAGQSNVTH